MRPLLALLILLLGVLPAYAQKYAVNAHHYGVEDGLSHRETYCAYRSSNGYVWIGTQHGVNRFDGVSFRWFTKENNQLSSNAVHQILEDDQGWLWLISYLPPLLRNEVQSISLLNPQTGTVTTPEALYGDAFAGMEAAVHRVVQLPNRQLCFGTDDGRIVFFQEGRFESHQLPDARNVSPAGFSPQGKLLISANFSDQAARVYVEFEPQGAHLNTLPSKPMLPLGTQGSNFWFSHVEVNDGSALHLYRWNPDQELVPVALPPQPSVSGWLKHDWTSQFFLDQHTGLFWFYDQTTLVVFHPDEGIIFDFGKQFESLIGSGIRFIDFDDAGNTWISTGNGFYVVQLQQEIFRSYLHKAADATEGSISCRAMLEMDGALYVNTQDSGVYRVDVSSGTSSKLPPVPFLDDNGQTGWIESFVAAIQTGPGSMMLGGDYVVERDLEGQTTRSIYLRRGKAWSLHRDEQQRVWIGNQFGHLFYADPGMDTVLVYEQTNDFHLPENTIIYHFLEVSDALLLMATSSGVYELNRQKGFTNRFWSGAEAGARLPVDIVHHMYADSEGAIWLATGGGGLVRWNYTPGQGSAGFQQYTLSAGITNNTLYAVYEDDFNNLWLPSDYGLICFNRTTLFSNTYLEIDGISHHEFNRTSHFQGADGTLYFGGLNGITAFHPQHVAGPATRQHPLVVSQFQQFDGASEQLVDRTNTLISANEIVLQPGDNFFRLEFALLDFSAPDRIRYAYKIEGQDKDWIYINDNSVRVSGLEYGVFQLRVKGQKPNGQFSAHELNIPIRVLKPWYFRTWALLLFVGALVVLTALTIRTRTRQLKQRQRQLETLVRERTATIEQQAEELRSLDAAKSRFFANVSHELRTPLTLMKGPLSSMLKGGRLQEKDAAMAKLAQGNTERLSQLVNELLNLSRLEAGKMELHEQTVALHAFIHRVAASFESHAQQQGMLFEFQYQPKPQLQVRLDADMCAKVLNNLLSNAFKFTSQGGEIKLHVADLGNRIEIRVSDTGRGIHPNDLPHIFDRFYQSRQKNAPTEGGTGIGLALSQELAHAMQGTIKAESTLGSGSSFVFAFPKKEVMGTIENAPLDEIPDATSTAVEPLTSIPATSATKPNVLVVEDNQSLRAYIALVLSEHFSVYEAANGVEAWNLLQGHSFELMVSDIMMPEMDGFQLVNKVKSSDALAQLPVIMLTARAADTDKLKALRMGIDDYMLKPFEEEELLARVQNLVRNTHLRREERNNQEAQQEETSGPEKGEVAVEQLLSVHDQQWLAKLEQLVLKRCTEHDFTVEVLASDMAASRQHLTRKIKQLTGLTAIQYLQEARMNRARTILESGSLAAVKAVAMECGFQDVRYFSRQFKTRFGKTPSAYRS